MDPVFEYFFYTAIPLEVAIVGALAVYRVLTS